jgi:hypothetical protein
MLIKMGKKRLVLLTILVSFVIIIQFPNSAVSESQHDEIIDNLKKQAAY